MEEALHAAEGVEPSSQRHFFPGRPLPDKTKAEELKVRPEGLCCAGYNVPTFAEPAPGEN